MKVRFVLPNLDGGEPVFDKTVFLSEAPLPGETVGIDPEVDFPDPEASRLVEVAHRVWYVGGEEPVLECWLTDSPTEHRRNLYVRSGCRYGYEQMMASLLPPAHVLDPDL